VLRPVGRPGTAADFTIELDTVAVDVRVEVHDPRKPFGR
jgi:hypothetical protein